MHRYFFLSFSIFIFKNYANDNSQYSKAVNVVAREARISLVDVYSATEVRYYYCLFIVENKFKTAFVQCFTCGTLGELVPVVLVDGRVIGNGARGPVTEKLQNHFKKLTASKGTPISQ